MNTTQVTPSQSAALNQKEVKTTSSIDPKVERTKKIAKKAIEEGWEMISTGEKSSLPSRTLLTSSEENPQRKEVDLSETFIGEKLRSNLDLSPENVNRTCTDTSQTIYPEAITSSSSGEVTHRTTIDKKHATFDGPYPESQTVRTEESDDDQEIDLPCTVS